MEPTRAERRANVEWGGSWDSDRDDGGDDDEEDVKGGEDFRGRKGEKCFIIRRGPMVFTRKVCRIFASSSWEGDFSGWRMPGRMKARWRWDEGGGKRWWQRRAAAAIVDSSVGCVLLY